MSGSLGTCPISPAANPAKPAPSSTRSSRCAAGNELRARAGVHVDELGEEELDPALGDVVGCPRGARFGHVVAIELLLGLGGRFVPRHAGGGFYRSRIDTRYDVGCVRRGRASWSFTSFTAISTISQSSRGGRGRRAP